MNRVIKEKCPLCGKEIVHGPYRDICPYCDYNVSASARQYIAVLTKRLAERDALLERALPKIRPSIEVKYAGSGMGNPTPVDATLIADIRAALGEVENE